LVLSGLATGIPDTEQFAGALVAVPLLTTGTDPSADSWVNQTVCGFALCACRLFRVPRSFSSCELPDALYEILNLTHQCIESW